MHPQDAVNLEDMARDCDEPSLRTITQGSGRRVHVLAFISVSAFGGGKAGPHGDRSCSFLWLKVKGTRYGRGGGRAIRIESTTLPLRLRWSQSQNVMQMAFQAVFHVDKYRVNGALEERWAKATWDFCPDSASASPDPESLLRMTEKWT